MAGPQHVRLDHRVTAIEQDRCGVLVRALAGRRRVTLRGSHVVVAVPLGVLKRGTIAFGPGLPEAKRAAMSRLGFGTVEKVAMAFDEPFWSDATHTHVLYISDHAPMELPYMVDMNRSHGVPALVAFYGGPAARPILSLDPEARLALTLDRLGEMMGHGVPRPRAFRATGWHDDPFSCGSYSAMRVGASPDDMDVLAAPVAGRVLFAGEATNRARHSTADGAMSSGIREAKRLLGAPAVTLSAG
jgi:polyamine oxidase